MVTIEWEAGSKGGDITVTPTGVSVGTECHGCWSEETKDIEQITKLRDALTELLESWGVKQ